MFLLQNIKPVPFVHAGLWDMLGQDQAGSIAAAPGGLDELIDDDVVGQ